MIKFEWDSSKAYANHRKHGFSLEGAKFVFYDEFAVQFFDEIYSTLEKQFLMLGMSNQANMLLVCHCVRDNDTTIRIISARKATRNERKLYRGE